MNFKFKEDILDGDNTTWYYLHKVEHHENKFRQKRGEFKELTLKFTEKD